MILNFLYCKLKTTQNSHVSMMYFCIDSQPKIHHYPSVFFLELINIRLGISSLTTSFSGFVVRVRVTLVMLLNLVPRVLRLRAEDSGYKIERCWEPISYPESSRRPAKTKKPEDSGHEIGWNETTFWSGALEPWSSRSPGALCFV